MPQTPELGAAKAAMGAMPNKTDRNDARGMAQIMRAGWYRTVHVKRPPCRSWRALLFDAESRARRTEAGREVAEARAAAAESAAEQARTEIQAAQFAHWARPTPTGLEQVAAAAARGAAILHRSDHLG